MRFEMTYNEALKIQRAQMVWYRHLIGRAGCKQIIKDTLLPNFNPDKPMPVHVINEYVPRGCNFEWIFSKRPISSLKRGCPNSMAWHDDILKDKVYH